MDPFARVRSVAQSSECRYKVGSILLRKGKVVGEATNSMKTHPIQFHWATKAGNPKAIHLHAEIHSLITCREEYDTMIVARVDKKGEFKIARPCKICLGAILASDVKHLYFTNEDGEWEYEEIRRN